MPQTESDRSKIAAQCYESAWRMLGARSGMMETVAATREVITRSREVLAETDSVFSGARRNLKSRPSEPGDFGNAATNLLGIGTDAADGLIAFARQRRGHHPRTKSRDLNAPFAQAEEFEESIEADRKLLRDMFRSKRRGDFCILTSRSLIARGRRSLNSLAAPETPRDRLQDFEISG